MGVVAACLEHHWVEILLTALGSVSLDSFSCLGLNLCVLPFAKLP